MQVRVLPDHPVKKVASGVDHIALLTQSGYIFTFGNSEQGQLGRVPEYFAQRGGRRGGYISLRSSY
jgi:regulator of chromosome condensation